MPTDNETTTNKDNYDKHFNDVLSNSQTFNHIPSNLQQSSEFLSRILFYKPDLFKTADVTIINTNEELLKAINTKPIDSLNKQRFAALKLANESIKSRQFCLDMVNINPINIRYVPDMYKYDSEFICSSLQANSDTIHYLPNFIRKSKKYALIVAKNNGKNIKYFHNSCLGSRDVIISALNTHGFILNSLDIAEDQIDVLLTDSEIAEKSLMMNEKSAALFKQNNPLLNDPFFAIKIMKANPKLFSVFSDEIRNNENIILELIKDRCIDDIQYMVKQHPLLYPKQLNLAMREFSKHLTEEERQSNKNFYHYFNSLLYKNRSEEFIASIKRKNERQKLFAQEQEQRHQQELEDRLSIHFLNESANQSNSAEMSHDQKVQNNIAQNNLIKDITDSDASPITELLLQPAESLVLEPIQTNEQTQEKKQSSNAGYIFIPGNRKDINKKLEKDNLSQSNQEFLAKNENKPSFATETPNESTPKTYNPSQEEKPQTRLNQTQNKTNKSIKQEPIFDLDTPQQFSQAQKAMLRAYGQDVNLNDTHVNTKAEKPKERKRVFL